MRVSKKALFVFLMVLLLVISFGISAKAVAAAEDIQYSNDYYSCTIRVDTSEAELEMYNIKHGKGDTLTVVINSNCYIEDSGKFKAGAIIPLGPSLVVELESPSGEIVATKETSIWEVGLLGTVTLIDYTSSCRKGNSLACKNAEDYISGSHRTTVRFHLSEEEAESGTWKVVVYDKDHPSEKIVSEIEAGGYICGPASMLGFALLSLTLSSIRRRNNM